jgi:serine/threonine protein kinase
VTRVAEVLADRYEVGAHLGSGGMGDVYRARDRLLDRPVAVKVPSSSYGSVPAERFHREARAAARLNHPNIVTVYDWGEGPDPFIVMELVDGDSLRVMLSERGPLPPAEVASIGAKIADALAHAHQHGVVHRDVKPSNVLVSGGNEVKVTDFGIARSDRGEALTEPGLVLGTTGYLSPEQAAGLPADARSDIYSLGIVLAELLSGERKGADLNPSPSWNESWRGHAPLTRARAINALPICEMTCGARSAPRRRSRRRSSRRRWHRQPRVAASGGSVTTRSCSRHRSSFWSGPPWPTRSSRSARRLSPCPTSSTVTSSLRWR